MNERPEQLKLLRQWIDRAEEDLKNAEHTLTLQEGCPSCGVHDRLTRVCRHVGRACRAGHLHSIMTVEFGGSVPGMTFRKNLTLGPLPGTFRGM